MFKNSRSTGLAYPKKVLHFFRWGPTLATSPLCLDGGAGLEGAWCVGLPPPCAPSRAEFGEAGRPVCACSMCWNVWVLWRILTRQVKQTCAPPWLGWGGGVKRPCRLLWGLKTWEGFSQGWKLPHSHPPPRPPAVQFVFILCEGKTHLFLFWIIEG